jgi:hypothetical protein
MLTTPPTSRGREWLRNVLSGLTHDNTAVVKRPGAKEVLDQVFRAVRVDYRTRHIPTSLGKIDDAALEKVMQPRSIYKYSVFKQNILPFTQVKDEPCTYENLFEEFKSDVCWRPSSDFVFNPTLPRNRRALRNAAGLPEGGKKADALQGAIQYNNNIVKPSNSIDKCWADVPGYRTQQSDPDDPKVRLIFARSCHLWQMEAEALDDSITKTINESVSLNHRIQVFYFDARALLKEWMNKYSDRVTHWVYLDAKNFDRDVQSKEIGACWTYLAPDYPWLDLMIECSAHGSIIMPEGIVNRNGGMPSGSKVTNMGDGISNVFDNLECLKVLRLDKYLECILVNGDDISFGFSTRITNDNMLKWANLTRRTVSPEKSILFDDALVNSKWYCNGSILTRSIFRAINSLAFKEREASALSANAVYVAIARHQILLDVEEHPCYEVLAKELAKYEEYTLADAMEDPRWSETVEYFIGTHDYMGNIDADDFVSAMAKSRYATEFAP